MPDLGPDILEDIVAACTEGAAEVAESLGRALDVEGDITVAVTSSREWNPTEPPAGFDGPGLVAVLSLGDVAALVLLPDGFGNAVDDDKLATLGQEVGVIVLPPAFMADQFRAGHVESLITTLEQAGVAEQAGMVNLSLTAEGREGTMTIVWPASQASNVAVTPIEVEEDTPAKADVTHENIKPRPRDSSSLENLPVYARSLLKVEVPVTVKLAAKKQTVDEILRLGAGSIIQFDKSCEETLEMDAGGHRIAEGEAVKVDDKFGLRITSMILPDERFQAVRG